MSFSEYEQHDAIGLADLIRRGEVSAAEVIDAAIARVEARNPHDETLSAGGSSWDDFLRRLLDEIPFTPLFNASGAPAASLPMARSARGMPVGVQLGAALGREDMLLQLSAQLEAAHPWRNV